MKSDGDAQFGSRSLNELFTSCPERSNDLLRRSETDSTS
jgi:hypothetical protein